MKQCKDCRAELEAWEPPDPMPTSGTRPAPHPGPRCTSHHRKEQRRRKAAAHEKRVQKTYGLSPGEYQALYALQGGRCALCKRATGAARKLSVDHDHKSGAVRGLLCRPCNTMLGHGRDDVAFFHRAASYLKQPPASHLKPCDVDPAECPIHKPGARWEPDRGKE